MKITSQYRGRALVLRWQDTAILAICSFVLAAVLFPVFAKPNTSRQIFVFDESGKPVPHARLTFRTGNRFLPYYVVPTDKFGHSYDRRGTDLAPNVVGEYALQTTQRNTGWKAWVFSPRGTQTFIVRDEKGAPLPDVPIRLSHPSHRYGGLRHNPDHSLVYRTYRTDQQGRITFPNVGLAQRFEPSIEDEHYVVKSVRITTGSDEVKYDVQVSKPATLTGVVTSPDGTAMEKMVVSLRMVPEEDQRDSFVTHTHANGRFLIPGLPPGKYATRVGRRMPNSLPGSPPAATIYVRAGEVKRAALHVP
jgi:protocatechuate 3,4-dioxygenase beta subunit